MITPFKNISFLLICFLACHSGVSKPEPQDTKQRINIIKDSISQKETTSKVIPKEVPVFNESNAASPPAPSKCFFKGSVYHQYGPSTFNTIWITGLSKNNRGIAQKISTDEKGMYSISLKPGKYNIEVYGPEGVIAKQQIEMDCTHVILPTIKYQK